MKTIVALLGVGLSALAVLSTTAAAKPKERLVFWDLPYKESDGKKPGVEGSILAIGDPVHETLTVVAARDAGVIPMNTKISDPAARQFIRGVFWNDDPCAQLFTDNYSLSASAGLEWWWDFRRADKERPPKGFSALTCKRVGRSHFGDLQFLHGMASGDGIPAGDTLKLVVAWAHFTYDVAIGSIAPTAPLAGVAELAPLPAFDDQTPQALFQSDNAVSLRQRAIGSLLHMIQDSYAKGHTLREVGPNGSFGKITKFRSYARQDHAKHKADDMWQGGNTDIEKIRKFRGGSESLAASTEVLKFFKAKAQWATVEAYLRKGPFLLADKTLPSGP